MYEYYETTDHRPLHIGTKYQLYIYGTVKPRVVTRVYDGLILTTQRGSRWKMWCKVIQRCKPPHRRCMSQTGPAFSLGHRVSPHTRTFGSQPYSHTLPQSAVLMVSTSAVHAIHELLLIYRLGRDGRLSCLVGWPTTDSLPWAAVHQRLGTGQGKSAGPKTDVLTTELRRRLTGEGTKWEGGNDTELLKILGVKVSQTV